MAPDVRVRFNLTFFYMLSTVCLDEVIVFWYTSRLGPNVLENTRCRRTFWKRCFGFYPNPSPNTQPRDFLSIYGEYLQQPRSTMGHVILNIKTNNENIMLFK